MVKKKKRKKHTQLTSTRKELSPVRKKRKKHTKNKESRKKHKSSKKIKIRKKSEKDWVSIFSISFCMFVLLLTATFYFKFSKGEIISASMEPTLKVEDKVIINKFKYIRRFSLVVFTPPDNGNEQWVKRVIGFPGEKVEYKDDQLFINGEKVAEDFLQEVREDFQKAHPNECFTEDFTVENIPGLAQGTKIIPKDCYLMLGDNRQQSKDSRYIGMIQKENILGTVFLRLPKKK